MDILEGFKLCRKGLHWYPDKEKRCLQCKKEYRKNYYRNNKDKKIAYDQKYYQNNPDKRKVSCRKWRKENPGKANANTARRRSLQKKSMPSWASPCKIKKIYEKAAELTKSTGIAHEVDHIYPLQNKYMCGLHVETNLQILTKEENASKGNRTWPGQLDCQKD